MTVRALTCLDVLDTARTDTVTLTARLGATVLTTSTVAPVSGQATTALTVTAVGLVDGVATAGALTLGTTQVSVRAAAPAFLASLSSQRTISGRTTGLSIRCGSLVGLLVTGTQSPAPSVSRTAVRTSSVKLVDAYGDLARTSGAVSVAVPPPVGATTTLTIPAGA